MPRVRITLLSGFAVTTGGHSLSLQPAVQRLVALIALSRNGLRRDAAAYRLWPDTSEKRAKANLRSTLWRLGKAEAAILESHEGRLVLAEGVWVDTRDGVRELTRGRLDDDIHADLPFQDLESGLLPDWYDEWIENERERLRQLVLGVLEARATRALQRGDYRDAIHTGLSAVSLEPLRESARRIVIEAHLAQGNQIEARREYRRYCTSLDHHGGLAPSRAITAMMEDLRQHGGSWATMRPLTDEPASPRVPTPI